MKSQIFISAIDTDAGKTMITGLIARYLKNKDKSVITQKFAQTGCQDISEDIIEHRNIMGSPLNEFDKNKTTCPYVFDLPASPHLSAKLQDQKIDVDLIRKSSEKLLENYDYLLLEGVGGLHVPIYETYSLLDFLEEEKLPLVLVSSPKLGSINHTLMSLEIIKNRNIPLQAVVYNNYPDNNKEIVNDTKDVIKKFLIKYELDCPIVDVPVIKDIFEDVEIDFSPLFK
ncbi:MAG: dethiobiotin synthase [Marinifilaceae bacterium]|jgi:dethiobiotin synthetase|nr:dethiobiotin synthase [Marinifilaceae bacterium]